MPMRSSSLADLGLIGASLAAHQGEHAGGFALRRLVRRVQAFGFHLATLDLRQDSATHDAALAALFADRRGPRARRTSARSWPTGCGTRGRRRARRGRR